MKEDFLHFLWYHKLFSTRQMKTVQGEDIYVIKSGEYNTNAGPDFLHAQLQIDYQIWVGNVEMHVKSSDWYAHHHETNKDYDAIILHVVWEHDAEIYMKNNQPIPTLVLKDYVHHQVFMNYLSLRVRNKEWISCGTQIGNVDSFLLNNWLEKLYIERLEKKAVLIQELLKQSNNNYEAVLFWLLAKNFGLDVNGDAFLKLARSFDYSVLMKVRHDQTLLSALLFGQAGFLEEDTVQDPYFLALKKEYAFLKHKFKLQGVAKHQFKFFRMRPSNFPTIRIAQLIALIHDYSHLFSRINKSNSLHDFYELFAVEVPSFWKTHYTFMSVSKKTSKKLTRSFIDLLLINTIIPMKYVHAKNNGYFTEDVLFLLIKEIKPEVNSIVSKFLSLKVKAKNAFETQALLELKKNYCSKKRCVSCGVGIRILKDKTYIRFNKKS